MDTKVYLEWCFVEIEADIALIQPNPSNRDAALETDRVCQHGPSQVQVQHVLALGTRGLNKRGLQRISSLDDTSLVAALKSVFIINSGSQITFHFNGVSLKTLPVGVLYDLHADKSVFSITVVTDEVHNKRSIEAYETFVNSIKMADYIRYGNIKRVLGMSVESLRKLHEYSTTNHDGNRLLIEGYMLLCECLCKDVITGGIPVQLHKQDGSAVISIVPLTQSTVAEAIKWEGSVFLHGLNVAIVPIVWFVNTNPGFMKMLVFKTLRSIWFLGLEQVLANSKLYCQSRISSITDCKAWL